MAEWTIFSILAWTASYFEARHIDSPRLTAEMLLAHCLGVRRIDLYLSHDKPLQPGELREFKSFISRRIRNEPVAYITGKKGFYDLEFDVAPGVLIPRPDTETLLEQALEAIDYLRARDEARRLSVMELGVGSGALIASIAAARPGHRYFGCDISKAAVAVARKNIGIHAGDRVDLFIGSWLEAVRAGGGLDIIVSNPPYIPSGDIPDLPPEIRDFEPLTALDGGCDGGDAFRQIMAAAPHVLRDGGMLLLEMGYDQKPLMEKLSRQYPAVGICGFVSDLAGHDRVAVFKKNN